MSQEAFILEEREFAFLLQAKGISGFQGFFIRNSPKTREELLQVLRQLTEKGFLVSDGEQFQVLPELAEGIKILEYAKGVLVLNPADKEAPQAFCYMAESSRLFICQPAAFRRGAVKLWTTDWNGLEQFIRASGRKMELCYYKKGSSRANKVLSLLCREKSYVCCWENSGQETEEEWETLERMLKQEMEDEII